MSPTSALLTSSRRMEQEHCDQYPSRWDAGPSVAPQISGVTANAAGLDQVRGDRYRGALRRHNQLSPASQGTGAVGQETVPCQRDPEAGQGVFRPGGARWGSLPATHQILRQFVEQHHDAFGIEPICKVSQAAPSGHWRHAALFH